MTEGEALWSQVSFCVFCKEPLKSLNEPDVKQCPLEHGCVFLFDEEFGETQKILFEPSFLIFKRERPSPWGFPEGKFEPTGTVTEQDILHSLLAHCPLCASSLILDPSIPEVKTCPSEHGIVYVYEQDYVQQVIAFEPSLLMIEEEI